MRPNLQLAAHLMAAVTFAPKNSFSRSLKVIVFDTDALQTDLKFSLWRVSEA